MQSSLGIFIEKNMIKYAKLQKDKDTIEVESYNTTFYEANDLRKTIDTIVDETNSAKIPISINLYNELYTMYTVPSLLGKKDAKKAADIEYNAFCNENNKNKITNEPRYLFVDDTSDPESQRVLNVIADRGTLTKISSDFKGYKVSTISPIPVSVTNLIEKDEIENSIIVNIEEKTYVTTVLQGEIYQFDVIDTGMAEILEYINNTENSFSKSYEVCRNMSIYAQDEQDSYSDVGEYMEFARGKLYDIVEKVKKIIDNMFSPISKIYITGSGTCINNIDLFFQEFLSSSKCEILKPAFLGDLTADIPIKEYIEVNSAIAVALDGLGQVNKDMNFSRGMNLLPSFGGVKIAEDSKLKQDIDFKQIKEAATKAGTKIASDFKSPLGSAEKLMMRSSVACVLTILIFSIFSTVISKQINEKEKVVESAISETNIQLGKLNDDISSISARITTYEGLITEMTATPEEEEVTSEEEQVNPQERIISKDSIPNLLNRIMFVIPKKVKLISIKNTTSDHIVISAEAEKYEQLGYFKAVLTTNGILENVKSTSGEKTGSTVQVTIEGDLP